MVFGMFRKKPKGNHFEAKRDFEERTKNAPLYQEDAHKQIEQDPFSVPQDQRNLDVEVERHEKMMMQDFKKQGVK